jgi:hypothetical protein
MEVRTLTDDDRRKLGEWIDETKEILTTFGDKVYDSFANLAKALPAMASEFDDIGKGLLETLNKKLPEDNRMARMKNQELVILTFGPQMKRNWVARSRKQPKKKGQPPDRLLGQLPHIDAPATVPDIPVAVVPFYSCFVSMTRPIPV